MYFIVQCIEAQNIPEYEVIIVGNVDVHRDKVRVIPFDEAVKPGWITRKKNIITKNARYDNIVFMHDYIFPLPGWYDGFLKFGDDFDVAMNVMVNLDCSRFRDWTLWTDLEEVMNSRGFLIPYDMVHLTRYMYVSGSYWVAKKSIMEKYQLDETLVWGESEDVEWSKRIRGTVNYRMNVNSAVRLMKQKDKVFHYSSVSDIKFLNGIR